MSKLDYGVVWETTLYSFKHSKTGAGGYVNGIITAANDEEEISGSGKHPSVKIDDQDLGACQLFYWYSSISAEMQIRFPE